MPLNRLTAFFSNRAVSRSENLNAVRCSSLSGKLPAANAAAPLMPSGDPSQRGKVIMGLSLALYSARAEDVPSGWRAPDGLWAICQPSPAAASRPEIAAAAVALS
jgi:hypothetical protein